MVPTQNCMATLAQHLSYKMLMCTLKEHFPLISEAGTIFLHQDLAAGDGMKTYHFGMPTSHQVIMAFPDKTQHNPRHDKMLQQPFWASQPAKQV